MQFGPIPSFSGSMSGMKEAAAFAAGAEAHVTNRLAVCAGSCGPGNLHVINGLYDCYHGAAGGRFQLVHGEVRSERTRRRSHLFRQDKPAGSHSSGIGNLTG